MDELLQRLEKKIKDLIDQHDGLKNSHQKLHQSKFVLTRDHEFLLMKQQKAITQIETLISKLKAIEK